ncbi:DUF7311 family protein [Halomarina rubra]|uniref:DUF7311 domain-containing protein n=1 Tax=Halomarina rubra TaxID=2071873 RepID=A0ABD6AQA5_9EURY|nr:hypothetical protein [Halomarina rubra]
MALRIVLAALLTSALVAVALPVVDDARTATSAATLDTASDRVRTVGERLVATSDPVARGSAARRVLTVSVPRRGWGTRTGHLRVGDGRIAWRVGDGPWHTERAPRLVVSDGPLVVRGETRLVFTHRLHDGESVVVVRRGFKTEAEATADHVTARTPPRGRRGRLSMHPLVRR